MRDKGMVDGLVLVADRLLTLDTDNTVYAPGALALTGDHIAAVGAPEDMPDLPVMRLPGHLLMPGLVNTHTHTPMWLFRGLTEDVPRGAWLSERMRPLERQVTPADLAAGALVGCLEMLLNGITTIADRYAHMDAVTPAVVASGLRAIVAHSLYDDTAEDGLEVTQRLVERYGTDGARSRITVAIGPHATDTCGPDLLRRVRALADRCGARTVIHLAQSAGEVEAVRQRHGLGCAAYLDYLGLLAPDVVVAHALYLSPAEAALVGQRGTAVAHCPSSNAKLEARVAPIGQMRAAGAVVGLGTDAACCSNGMDLFEEMKLAGLVNKIAAGDPAVCGTTDLLRMATIDGARALGLDGLIGSLEAGKRADLIAVRTSGVRVQPWHQDAANLVYTARGLDVSDVWIDGAQLVRDGRPTGHDLAAVVAEGAARAAKLNHANT
ncbi:MAG: amidohydrolase [Chloroflexi bacterium]|nr:amidohydrolase [Chloroflexota bacterium]